MLRREVSLGVVLAASLCGLAPAAPGAALPRLEARGTRWLDEEGRPVVLRGVNLGNWLVQEMWMHNMGVSGIPDEYTLESVLARRFGAEAKERLLRAYRDSYMTERDFEIIRSFGMNLIRLPFVYTILEDDTRPFQLRPDAFLYLDRAIDLAEAHGMYTILDMHGAPGRQSGMDHTGRTGFNRLFFEKTYQDRTVWLWEQIASRYRDRSAVAAYDILNEPWGSSKDALRSLVLRIYSAARALDPSHMILLPGYHDGFEFYGRPGDQGMTNVANTMHFYPGFFGWGDPSVATHRDWLTEGVFGWRDRVGAQRVPFLVGEMNVVSKAAGGGEMMRHSFDIYGALGWGTAMWSYKVFTLGGGIGGGIWGMVTNPPGAGAPRVKASTWTCPGWSSAFQDACEHNYLAYSAPGSGPVTVYLLLKAGACCGGSFDVVFDEVSLKDDETGEEKVVNGGFGNAMGWTSWRHAGTVGRDFAYAGVAPVGGKGPGLRLWGSDFSNGGVYQALHLEGGRIYTLGGSFRDKGSAAQSAWAEVYLRTDRPVDGIDHAAGPVAGSEIDVNTSGYDAILGYFEGLASMDYVIDDDLRYWLKTTREPGLFTPPLIADWYAFGSMDGWQTPGTEMVETARGSRIYRRDVNLGAPPVLHWWKALRTDSSEEYPGGWGVDAWVKHDSSSALQLFLDENPRGDGWLPDADFLYQRPTYVARTYVAVGSFQREIGDTNWNEDSDITILSDDGRTRGDLVAGDGIYTLEIAIPTPGTYLFTGILADRSWQTRITAISTTGDTPAGEISFTTTRKSQRVRILCDIALNRVKLELEDGGGSQRPGDANQDGGLDLSDAIWLLGHLFLGTSARLPCEGGTSAQPGPGELSLIDFNGDGTIDLSDAVSILGFLFLGTKPPVLGTECVPIPGCPDRCP